MATTKIANVIVPEVYNPYVLQKEVQLNQIIASGIATSDPDLKFPNVAGGVKGGKTIHIPFWKSLTGSSASDEILDDTNALQVNNITSGESIAAIHVRGKAWGANDLARFFSGDDPMAAIGDMNAAYWANAFQHVLVKTLEGITDGTSGAIKAHTLDISGGSGGDEILSSEAMVDAMYLMGDHASDLAGVMMHSLAMAKLVKLNLIDTIRDADNDMEYKAYMGKRVIVDDSLTATAGAYPIYFFGQGAVAFNEDTEDLDVTETDRDSLGGNDILISRRAFIMHPRGLQWTGTASGATPSNSELAIPGNWALADDIKNVPITKLVAKLA